MGSILLLKEILLLAFDTSDIICNYLSIAPRLYNLYWDPGSVKGQELCGLDICNSCLRIEISVCLTVLFCHISASLGVSR